MNDSMVFDEAFRDCPYNQFLQVSQYGRVKNKTTNEILPQKMKNNCYIVDDPRGTIQYDLETRDYEWVHRLVALTWLTDSPYYMRGEVHHKNNNGFDNRLDNLSWVSGDGHKKIHGFK